jgi:hypothetical protein
MSYWLRVTGKKEVRWGVILGSRVRANRVGSEAGLRITWLRQPVGYSQMVVRSVARAAQIVESSWYLSQVNKQREGSNGIHKVIRTY